MADAFIPVYYTAVDATIILSNHDAAMRSLRKALRVLGFDQATLVRFGRKIGDDDRAAEFQSEFARIAGAVSDARRADIVRYLAGLDHMRLSDLSRRRLAAVGIDADVLELFVVGMAQQIHVRRGDAIVSLRFMPDPGGFELRFGLGGGVAVEMHWQGSESASFEPALADSVVVALPGRPLSTLFEHPLLLGADPAILSAHQTGVGTTVIYASPPLG